jgi:hypothetical protein
MRFKTEDLIGVVGDYTLLIVLVNAEYLSIEIRIALIER